MTELVPSDLEAESTACVDGFTYTATVVHDEAGYRAHLTWQGRQEEQTLRHFQTPARP